MLYVEITKFHQNLSSGSGVEFKTEKKSGQMDGRQTDARQRKSHNNRSEEPSAPVSYNER